MKDSAGNRLLPLYSWACALLLTACFLAVAAFLVLKGYRAINWELIFAGTDPLDALFLRRQVFGGLFPAMVGTICLIFLSMGIALPLGICAGIYLSEYAPFRIKKVLGLGFDILAGVPSIVIGLFGFAITIFLHQAFNNRIFPCLVISAVSLAFLVLPYIIRSTQTALEELPLSLRLTGAGLGATRLQNLFYVLLPSCLSDIAGGAVLAMGRCAEDTAVIMLTGVVATAGVPKSVFSGFEALPFYIYYTATEYADQSELLRGYGAALILLMICLALFAASFFIKTKIAQKMRTG